MKLIKTILKTKGDNRYHKKPLSGDSKIIEFEKLVENHKDWTEDELLKEFYGDKFDRAAAKSLIYRLEAKLLNDFFLNMHEKEALDERAFAKPLVSKYYTIGLVFLKLFERAAAIELFQRVLKFSLFYEFTDFALLASNNLMFHYGLSQPNTKKMLEIIDQNQKLNQLFFQENNVQMIYVKVTHILIKNNGKLSPRFNSELRDEYEEMNLITSQYKSYENLLYTFDVTYQYYSIIGNHEKAAKTCIDLIGKIQDTKSTERLLSFTIRKNLGTSLFYLGNYEESIENLLLSLSLTKKGSRYWIFTTSVLFLSYSRLNDYQKLLDITIEVLNQKASFNWEMYQELWKIREAYIHLLIRTEKITIRPDQQNMLRNFSLSKFLNDVPFYSKDKTGQNINIICLQILFLLLEKKYNKIFDKAESLEQYTYRYILKNNYFRAHCFIKMVLNSIKASFHPFKTRRLNEDLFEKLKRVQVTIDDNDPQIEIIPYDIQWQIFLEILDKNAASAK